MKDKTEVADSYEIDPGKETLLTLQQAIKLPWLPKGRGGNAISASTLYRWVKHGRCGVVLPVLAGTVIVTTEGALRWAFLKVNEVARAGSVGSLR